MGGHWWGKGNGHFLPCSIVSTEVVRALTMYTTALLVLLPN